MSKMTTAQDIIQYTANFLDIDKSKIAVFEEEFELRVRVEGMTFEETQKLLDALQTMGPAGVTLDVEPVPKGEDPATWTPSDDEQDEQLPDISSTFNVSEDFNFDVDAVKAAVGIKAEEIRREMIDQIPKGMNIMKFQEGDLVEFETVDGSPGTGRITDIPDETAGRKDVPGQNRTVAQYWNEKAGESIPYNEPLVEIEMGSGEYSFPISKVDFHPDGISEVNGVDKDVMRVLKGQGFLDIGDLRTATRKELSDVAGIGVSKAVRIKADVGDYDLDETEETDSWGQELFDCNHCGEETSENEPGVVEGDHGELYCSFDCLMAAY